MSVREELADLLDKKSLDDYCDVFNGAFKPLIADSGCTRAALLLEDNDRYVWAATFVGDGKEILDYEQGIQEPEIALALPSHYLRPLIVDFKHRRQDILDKPNDTMKEMARKHLRQFTVLVSPGETAANFLLYLRMMASAAKHFGPIIPVFYRPHIRRVESYSSLIIDADTNVSRSI